MHDTLEYIKHEPIHRIYHHGEITFSILYAWSENFLLPFSHDEVVHGKGSLVNKIPGDRWQKLATLRALYGFMWAHPGKNLLFMGCEFAQNDEWSESKSLDWHLTEYGEHHGVQKTIQALNSQYKNTPALWQQDVTPAGFSWLIGDDAASNTLAFVRWDEAGNPLVCVTNFSPVPHENYLLPLPHAGQWHEILNTDLPEFGGSGVSNQIINAVEEETRGFAARAEIRVPPLATLWITPA